VTATGGRSPAIGSVGDGGSIETSDNQAAGEGRPRRGVGVPPAVRIGRAAGSPPATCRESRPGIGRIITTITGPEGLRTQPR